MTNPIFAGVDVGGTNTKVGLLTDSGQIIGNTQFPTEQALGAKHALGIASETIDSLLQQHSVASSDLAAIGLAVPGPMDIPAGKVLDPFNLPAWGQTVVRDMLAEITGHRVFFTNDANAAALGEFWMGGGKDFQSMILVTLGTGVGGGIILDGRDIIGANSHGAEIGHIIIDPSDDARVCSCGNTGHLEAYASASSVVDRCVEAMAAGTASSLSEVTAEELSTLKIYDAADAGDALAIKLIDETAGFLGKGIVSLAHVIDPQAVLIGGAMNFGANETAIGKKFLNDIRTVAKNCSLPALGQKLKIEFATLGGDAGFVGAAFLARRDHAAANIAAAAN